MKTDLRKCAAVLALFIALLVLGGCGEPRTPYAGTYRSEKSYAGKNIELDLKDSGKGTWSYGGKPVEFTWVVNDGKLWFYIKGGAILIATPGEEGKILSIDTTGDWHPGCPPNACEVFRRVQEGG